MKKVLLLFLAVMICFVLCSCDSILKIAKSAITGEEVSEPPADFIKTAETFNYVYEEYQSYIKLTEYIGDETEIVIPDEIEGKTVTTIGAT